MNMLLLLGCVVNSDPEPKRTAPQSKPISVKLGVEAESLAFEVATETLRTHLQTFEVPVDLWESATAVSNLIRSPCSPAWTQEWSIAQSLVSSDSCPQDTVVFQAVARRLLNDEDVNQIVFDLATPGPHYSDRDAEDTIEIWLSSKGVGFQSVIQRVRQLTGTAIRFIFYDNPSPAQQRLQELGSINVSEELGHNLSGWIDKNGDFDQIVAMVQQHVRPNTATTIQASPEVLEKYGIRSSPTLFVKGYRLRGLQSVQQIRLVQRYP